MSYFDKKNATSGESGRRGESLWQFLERSNWPRSAHIRAEISAALDLVDPPNRGEFVARLHSHDNREVEACWSELYAIFLFTRVGHAVEVSVDTPSGGTVDLRLDGGPNLEVHRPSASDASVADDHRRDELRRQIESFRSPKFWLSVSLNAPTSSSLARRIRRDVESWLDGLDWDEWRSRAGNGASPLDCPTRTWTSNGVSITIRAYPRTTVSEDAFTIGTSSGGPVLMTDTERVTTAIKNKLKQHRGLESLIVMLDVSATLVHDDEIAAALYGPTVDRADQYPRTITRRREVGLWPDQNADRRPSAVITIDDLAMGRMATARVTVWVRPGDKNIIGDGPWEVVTLAADGITIERAAATTQRPTLDSRP